MLPNFVATAMGFQWITWISLCGTNFSCQAMNTFQTIIQTNSRQCITLYNSWEIFCVINKRVKIFSILFIFYVEHDRSTNTAFGLNGLSPKSQHTWQQGVKSKGIPASSAKLPWNPKKSQVLKNVCYWNKLLVCSDKVPGSCELCWVERVSQFAWIV